MRICGCFHGNTKCTFRGDAAAIRISSIFARGYHAMHKIEHASASISAAKKM